MIERLKIRKGAPSGCGKDFSPGTTPVNFKKTHPQNHPKMVSNAHGPLRPAHSGLPVNEGKKF
jgi:hypothetical protein